MSATVLRCLSLGAGVQSTTLALMAAHGEVGPMPDCAIFADTMDEPQAVYNHLAWLRSPNVLPFPVYIVSAGSLSDDMLAGKDEARIPFFVGAGGIGKRQCTRNYKLRPIRRKLRELLGVGPRGYVRPGAVEQWIGISTNEASRLKPSGFRFITRRDPLIELGMSRQDCLSWLRKHGYPQPPKSACVYCPFQDREQWQSKNAYERAVITVVDRALRTPDNISRFRGKLFVHPSRVPFEEVDLSTWSERGQPDLFNMECEGMCGV